MKIKEILEFIADYTSYTVIGSFTGKKLFDNNTTEKTREKYLDLEVPEKPITIGVKPNKKIMETIICPQILIWAHDYDLVNKL